MPYSKLLNFLCGFWDRIVLPESFVTKSAISFNHKMCVGSKSFLVFFLQQVLSMANPPEYVWLPRDSELKWRKLSPQSSGLWHHGGAISTQVIRD